MQGIFEFLGLGPCPALEGREKRSVLALMESAVTYTKHK